MRIRTVLICLFLLLALLGGATTVAADEARAVVHIVYFYSTTCEHCMTVIEEVLTPLQAKYGDQLEIKMVEITDPDNYEMLIRAEEMFGVALEERGLPTLLVGGQVLIGEQAIREQLPCLVETCAATGGTSWPSIPGLAELAPAAESELGLGTVIGPGESAVAPCPADESEEGICRDLPPIRVAYFYEVGCRDCSRAEADIAYIRGRYPQVVVEELNIYDSVGLAEWLAQRVGRQDDLETPAVFVGDDALFGAGEISPQNLELLVQKYAATGTEAIWSGFEPGSVAERTLTPVRIAVAGLLDGLNPCAFATLIFFISYLAVSGRRGWQVLAVGAAFALGVFLAYLAIGLGLYRLLDLVRAQHRLVGTVVMGLTGLLCAVLAVLSFRDFLRARNGQIKDMALVLPEVLRKRVHAVIRRSSNARSFALGAFFTGAAVSILELACTGQVYFATLVSMLDSPTGQAQALPLLLLYNLMFVVPLVVVFALVYLGTSSQKLGLFLRRHTPAVKLGTALLFAAFAGWLLAPIIRQLL
ncbi:MAG: hypothetical protein GX601_09830 [Anaerolineales bacterium]|nr:hypothetical protein [Anaerolineales bacterium]